MLRKFLDWQLSLTEKGKPLEKLHPLIQAADTFLYEAPNQTTRGPHIRDAVDIKRWMILVVVALIPCVFMAVWNTGLQDMVYSSGNAKLMKEYLGSLGSFSDYLNFVMKDSRFLTILWNGLKIFVPIAIISYAVGGLCEALFAIARGHEISEGFLVSGILYALILPPTIPYWMVAVGVAAGIVLAKEVFGGSGMNIMNPALSCRAFLFFTFPGRMSGNVWVGSNPTTVRDSLVKMNQEAGLSSLDGFSQATRLNIFNVAPDIKKIHVDAIATNNLGDKVGSFEVIKEQFAAWNKEGALKLGELTQDQLKQFVTTPLTEGGLGLSPGYYEDAYQFSSLNFGIGPLNSDWGFFLGNKLGCLGETSTLACLLGAIFLIWTGIASWRTMLAMLLGAFLTASLFEWGSHFLGQDGGAFLSAQYAFPSYKHLLLGGLAFGLVFMATDPVSSPSLAPAKWIYGLFCGMVAIIIRIINPAYPEGVMLAILMGNVFAPLIDYYTALFMRKRRKRRVLA
jgi:Na+-transporting NADH:ubiquinone oxidoreductase subunit B